MGAIPSWDRNFASSTRGITSAALIFGHYLAQQGKQWSAIEVVRTIKESAIRLGDKELFGQGLINLWSLQERL